MGSDNSKCTVEDSNGVIYEGELLDGMVILLNLPYTRFKDPISNKYMLVI